MIILTAQYPGRVTGATAQYPLGSSKNETAPAANDGTPYDLPRANDVFGFQQALLKQLGITASGTADNADASQQIEAMHMATSLSRYYVDSGAADAYVLSTSILIQNPTAYYDGMEVFFKPDNDNTGASTVNVATIGAVDIVRQDGTALAAGDLLAGEFALLRYDSITGDFHLGVLPPASVAEMQAAVSLISFVTPGRQDQHPAHGKAKVTFNGSGGAAIIGQYNVASVVRAGAGIYDVTFSNPMPDANYVISGTADDDAAGAETYISRLAGDTKTVNSCRIRVRNATLGVVDSSLVGVIFS